MFPRTLPVMASITNQIHICSIIRHSHQPATTALLSKLCRGRIHPSAVPPDLRAASVRWYSLDFRLNSANLHSISENRPKTLLACHESDLRRSLMCACSVRVHSTVSNRDSQKMVLEASPKSVLPMLEKSLPLREEKAKEESVGPWRKVVEAADPYCKLMRMDKPIGTWLLFWPCSWSIAMAAAWGGVPPQLALHNLGLFLAGAFVMRGAGCTINDLWDRDIDGKVERTKERPLVSGALTERQALVFLAAQLSAGLAVLLQLNWYSVALGASSMVLVLTYPLAKRFTDYPQLFLGATFNWGALLGWSATLGELRPAACLPLYAGALCWTVVYDTIYAHQDKLDDARIGIKSTALKFGAHTKPMLALFGAGSLAGLATAGRAVGLDWPYYAALALVAAHVSRQIYTLQPDSPADCARKFRSNSLVGLLVLLGVVGGGWGLYRERRAGGERGAGGERAAQRAAGEQRAEPQSVAS